MISSCLDAADQVIATATNLRQPDPDVDCGPWENLSWLFVSEGVKTDETCQ